MARRDVASLDRTMNQSLGRIVSECFRDGSTGQQISEGGIISGQSAQTPLEVSEDQVYLLGTKLEKEGKIYRYSKCSTGTAGVAGTLLEAAPYNGGKDANETDMTIETASTAGSSFAYATMKSTGATAKNTFQYGHYTVSDGSASGGMGQIFRIASHPASTGAAEVKFTFEEAIPVGISTGSKATLLANEYKNWVIAPATTAVGKVIGVSRTAVPVATPYCWIQTRGIATVLCSTGTAITIGKRLHRDLTTAGSVVIDSATTGAANIVTECVGYAAAPADITDSATVYLTLE